MSQAYQCQAANMDNEILTIRDVAGLLKINEKTAYKLVAEGKIPSFKVGGLWRFRAGVSIPE
jgi:excisionase family DNA binding protein